MRIETYSDSLALLRGLSALKQRGLTAKGILFLALSAQGRIYLAIPDNLDQMNQLEQLGQSPAPGTTPQHPSATSQSALRVGEKLALRWPEGPDVPSRLFHFDSIHALRDDFYVVNGDRRLSQSGTAVDVGSVVGRFVRSGGATSVFFGCTPHQPGTWLQGGTQVVALHDFGIVEVVPVPSGLVARRMHDHRLYLLTFADIARTGHLEGWLPIYAAPFGNILLVERRVVKDRLVLSCERGLVEIELGDLPKVYERARLPIATPPPPSEDDWMTDDGTEGIQVESPAILGRMEREAFVLTRGFAQPWGLRDLAPAEVWGSPTGELADISSWLQQVGIAPQVL